MLDVEKVVSQLLESLECTVSVSGVDLCPSSGTGAHHVALIVKRNVLGERIDKRDLLGSGSHQTQLPSQDIPQLRDLIYTVLPQKLSTAIDTPIAVGRELGSVLFGANHHRAQFHDGEGDTG